MKTSYLIIIGAIFVAYLVFVLFMRARIQKRTAGVVEGRSAEEAMNDYLSQTIKGYNPADFSLAYGWVMARYDIERIFAYNDRQILVVPIKMLHGEPVMPQNQEIVNIDLADVDHLWLHRRGGNSGVRVYFDNERHTENFYDCNVSKKDICGQDNLPSFMRFIDSMESWAKRNGIKIED